MSPPEKPLNPLAPAPEPETPLGRLRILSSTAGVKASPLQLGGMSLGDTWGRIMGAMTKDEAFALLDAYVAAGGNTIDTANGYQHETSEIWIGEWMEARGNRDSIIIATKYSYNYRDYALGKGKAPNAFGNHKKSLHTSLRDSLKKLRTDYIDILYLHHWDYDSSIQEAMNALNLVVEQGKVLWLGISDCPAWIVSAANEYAVGHGKTPFSIYQGRWSVMDRDFERDILPMARHYGMALAPWGVLGRGRFLTKAQVEERKNSGDGLRGGMIFGAEQTEKEVKISAALEKVANELGDYSLTAVAVAYVMAKAPRVFPIVGGRKLEQLQDNIKGLEIRLSKEQIKELEDAVPFDLGFPYNFIGKDPRVEGGRGSVMATMSAFIDWQPAEKPIGYA